MLTELALAGLSTSLNRYLKLDPESARHLQAMAGKTIMLAWQDTDIKFYLSFHVDNVEIKSQPPQNIDTNITASMWGMLQLGLNPFQHKGLLPDDVEISGDLGLGQDVKNLFADLEIDWEEYLSHCTGDIIAHQVGNGVRAIKSWSKASRNSFKLHISVYLQEEIRALPPREELADFCSDVDELRNAVERASARLEILRG